MKKLFFVLGLIIIAHALSAQDPVAIKYAGKITVEDLKENLSIIASDAMEGRETGKRGQKMAAAFIRAYFEELGLQAPVSGNYLQPFSLYASVPGDIYVKAGDQKLKNFNEVLYLGSDDGEDLVKTSLVFAGKGREEDFNVVDVKGKAVLLLLEETQLYNLAEVTRAREKGAKAVLVCNTQSAEDFKELAAQMQLYLANGKMSLKKPAIAKGNSGMFFVPTASVETLTGTSFEKLQSAANDASGKALKKIKPSNIEYNIAIDIKMISSENVLGYLEGTDKKDELIVVTAHYDHIGKLAPSVKGDRINNGADDDGSGTVAVLSMAKAFVEAKKDGKGPRRSILFMLVSGEEKGLLGSDYYTQNPVFPLASTVANLNIDMVGRRDAQHKDSAAYVYVIGSDKLSTELHDLHEDVNNKYTNLVFDYTYNDENHPDRLYYRSDHWNFAKNDIPIIFYFDGIHEDYHKPSDEVDKIEFDLLHLRSKLVFFTAWHLANKEERVAPDAK